MASRKLVKRFWPARAQSEVAKLDDMSEVVDRAGCILLDDICNLKGARRTTRLFPEGWTSRSGQ